MQNLFIELHECKIGNDADRFGSGWEDLLTAQLAFYLRCDYAAAKTVASALLEEQVEVVDVTLQPSTRDGQPDLAFRLSDGRDLFLEHKIDSLLQPNQLRRYLNHGIVALISRRNITVPGVVLNHDDYIRPQDRPHFSWEDIFRALPAPDDPPTGHGQLRELFRSYMRELGLAPSNLPKHWKKLFEDRTEPENRRIQKEFGRLLNGVKLNLRQKFGLSVSDVSHKGMMAFAPNRTAWEHLYVYPRRLPAETVPRNMRERFEPGYESLAIEVVYDENKSEEVNELLTGLPVSFMDSMGHRWHRIGKSPISQNRIRVTVASPLPPFLAKDAALGVCLQMALEEPLNLVMQQLDHH